MVEKATIMFLNFGTACQNTEIKYNGALVFI